MLQKEYFNTSPSSNFAKVFREAGIYKSLKDIHSVDGEHNRINYEYYDDNGRVMNASLTLNNTDIPISNMRFEHSLNPVINEHRVSMHTYDDGFEMFCLDCMLTTGFVKTTNNTAHQYALMKLVEDECTGNEAVTIQRNVLEESKDL